MRTTKYTKVLSGIAAKAGLDSENLLAHENTALAEFINDGIRWCWEYYPWSETIKTEQRYFRDHWVAAINYAVGSEVYYSTDGKYYYCVKATSGSFLPPTNTAFWVPLVDSYAGIPEWSKSGTYATGARVMYSGSPYQVTGVQESTRFHFPHDGYDPTNTDVFSLIDRTFKRYVAWEQSGYGAIGTPISVTLDDPRINATEPLEFISGREGVMVEKLTSAFSSVWLKYREAPPEFTSSQWAAGSYDAGDIVQYNGDCHKALLTTTDTPGAAAWDKVEFPTILVPAVKELGYADWLIGDGQHEKAEISRIRALDLIVRELDKVEYQTDQNRAYLVQPKGTRRLHTEQGSAFANTDDLIGGLREGNVTDSLPVVGVELVIDIIPLEGSLTAGIFIIASAIGKNLFVTGNCIGTIDVHISAIGIQPNRYGTATADIDITVASWGTHIVRTANAQSTITVSSTATPTLTTILTGSASASISISVAGVTHIISQISGASVSISITAAASGVGIRQGSAAAGIVLGTSASSSVASVRSGAVNSTTLRVDVWGNLGHNWGLVHQEWSSRMLSSVPATTTGSTNTWKEGMLAIRPGSNHAGKIYGMGELHHWWWTQAGGTLTPNIYGSTSYGAYSNPRPLDYNLYGYGSSIENFNHTNVQMVQVVSGKKWIAALDANGDVFGAGPVGAPFPATQMLTKIPGISGVTKLAAGTDHLMYLKGNENELWGSGSNSREQLNAETQAANAGLFTTNHTTTPVQIVLAGSPNILDVSCGWNHTLAIAANTPNDDVLAWGDNRNGQCGVAWGGYGSVQYGAAWAPGSISTGQVAQSYTGPTTGPTTTAGTYQMGAWYRGSTYPGTLVYGNYDVHSQSWIGRTLTGNPTVIIATGNKSIWGTSTTSAPPASGHVHQLQCGSADGSEFAEMVSNSGSNLRMFGSSHCTATTNTDVNWSEWMTQPETAAGAEFYIKEAVTGKDGFTLGNYTFDDNFRSDSNRWGTLYLDYENELHMSWRRNDASDPATMTAERSYWTTDKPMSSAIDGLSKIRPLVNNTGTTLSDIKGIASGGDRWLIAANGTAYNAQIDMRGINSLAVFDPWPNFPGTFQ